MIAVIQCAAKKRPEAGHLESPVGQPVTFVAVPKAAPASGDVLHARPDDLSEYGWTWREALLKYNNDPGDNRLGLLPAWRLYQNHTYERLVGQLGVQNVFILSAGWGLVRSDFLTPYYDITFSPSAESWKRRRQADRYHDFCMLPPATNGEIVFFGGKDYVPLFCSMTRRAIGTRIVFYNAARVPLAPGCVLRRYQTSTRTNWHYECAGAFLDGALAVT